MTTRPTPTRETPPTPWRTVAIAACVIAVCALVIATVAVVVNWQRTNEAKDTGRDAATAASTAQEAIDQLLAQRVEARLNTCLKDKKFADAHNSLVFALSHTTIKARSAAEQAVVDEFAAGQYVAVPDCSPEGIAAFYAGQGGTTPPAPPAEPAQIDTTTTTTVKPRRTTTTTSTPASATTHATASIADRSASTTAPTCGGITLPEGVPCQ